MNESVIDPVIRSIRRLAILHVALGIAAIVTYWERPEAFVSHSHVKGREIALIAILKVFFAWTPYFISGYYSCTVLPERNSRATSVFIFIAIGIGIVAACLTLNIFGMKESPATWEVFAGVTIALLAAARLCASMWPKDETGWGKRL